MTTAEADNLIAEYQRTKSIDLRNRIIVAFLPLVRKLATVVHGRLVDRVDVNDLVSSGVFGLMRALEKFEPARGFRFATYAQQRIRGAMLDDIRRTDPMSRSSRDRTKIVSRAVDQFKAEHGRDPTRDELFVALKLPLNRFNTVSARQPVEPVSLDASIVSNDDGSHTRFSDTIAGRDPVDIDTKLDCESLLHRIVRDFGVTSGLFVRLRFLEGWTLDQCAEVLDGVSESAWSFRQKILLGQLRARYNASSFLPIAAKAVA